MVRLLDQSFTGTDEFEEYGQHLSDRLLPVCFSSEDVDDFRSVVRTVDLGLIRISEVWTRNAFVVRRTNKLIAAGNDDDFLKLGVQRSGVSEVSQGGRQSTLTAGSLMLYDTACPYQVDGTPSSRMQIVLVPRSVLGLPPTALRRLLGQPIDGRAGHGWLLTTYLDALTRELGAGIGKGSWHSAEAVLELIRALLTERLTPTNHGSRHDAKASFFLKVQLHIEERLSEPDLNVTSIAEAHHVSLRWLQQIFEERGHTLSGWIRARRLEHCRRDLANPALAGERVCSIGASWGLANPAHFSRLFKSKYGVTPRTYRAKALGVS
ncbi:transcriptional regulator [Mycobacterium tuberculosis variant microti OV254]|uniref:AraC-like ligand-binding domain-containing protein n=1 Tax=Mycobacterium simiae TaxID=1784 RepID=UPI00040351B8|nr:helix-turn-helix domain-containing protein [Mycobacterium simiae]PLV47506.1 transcriptional regulator [Mycobacterium tuberculosis variant microti OV254]BBX41708.1 AraC family transcriptional regulator [Mycobacterium simiae]